VSGYLICRNKQALPVLRTAIASAVPATISPTGSGGGMAGRATRFLSQPSIEACELVLRYGMLAVFVARLRTSTMADLAGSTGLSPLRFFIANLLGAVVYVPIAVGAGYAVGYGLGDRIESLRRFTGGAEHVLLAALAVAAVGIWLWRARRARAHPHA
jgi:membrane protein DedA with SNARE-associated domain